MSNQDTLETLLQNRQFTDQKLPEFYDALLSHPLITLGTYSGDVSHDTPRQQVLKHLRQDIVSWQDRDAQAPGIPVFTSKDNLHTSLPHYIGKTMTLHTPLLLEVMRDIPWWLNPQTKLATYIDVDTLNHLYQLDINKPPYVYHDITSRYPTDLVAALQTYWAQVPGITQAYIALATKTSSQGLYYLVRLQLQDSSIVDTLSNALISLSARYAPAGHSVDIQALQTPQHNTFADHAMLFYDHQWGNNVVPIRRPS